MAENWNKWLFEKLSQDTVILAEMAVKDILPGGSAEGRKDDIPFIIFKVGADVPELEGDMRAHASSTFSEIWIHDNPGSYARINRLLSHLKEAIEGPTDSASGGVACTWQGNSPELSDEGYGTIARYISFRMIGATQ